MKLVDRIKQFFIGLYISLKRFPESIFLSTATVVILIVIHENRSAFDYNIIETLGRIAMITALSVPLFLCLKVLFERLAHKSFLMSILMYIITTLIPILYYFFLLKDVNMVSVTRYIAVSLCLYLGFVFTPYFYKRSNFENYVIKLITRFFTTLIYSVVLYAGISAILFTIDKLLSIRIYSNFYYYVFLCIAGIFAPSFFLAGVPSYHDREIHSGDYPKLLKILLLYIVIPLIMVYTGILYIYFAKIIITFQWPVGLVAHLVIWYSIISTTVLFLTAPLVHENKFAAFFDFWFPKIILPPLLMMFISIGIRINAYGITENRYFLVITGLWIFMIMMYQNFAKVKRNIIIPITLALVSIISVFGPWSSYSISKFSQNKRFETILLRNSMLSDNAIVKPSAEISDNDKKEINGILSYFSNSHNLSDVKYLPQDFSLSEMEKYFGFSYYQSGHIESRDNYFSYYADLSIKPVDIKGYEYFMDSRGFYSTNDSGDSSIKLDYHADTTSFNIALNGQTIYSRDISHYAKQVHEKLGAQQTHNINPDDMTFYDETERCKVKFILHNIYGSENIASGDINIKGVEFYTLITLK